ncbi:concanavalin A-like lectin/glucanase [Clathrospora elynae]|uniref:chitinase n=1 Tax=Clathrospora elynae TaxID=706981 RepID=A0A6A5SVF5_9PLEO|nr:concanavalin A-like lectin/glucanase [Clathrospora elynae]
MRFTSFTAASALAVLATAQTFTDCNPMEKECPNDPAMSQTWDTDFTAGKDAIKGWKQTAGSLTYGPEGAEFTVAKKGDAPTIGSSTYLHFGYVEVVMKAAPGQGIISSIVLQSDNLDEVDWEWIGGVDSRVQMNYFGKGNTTTFDRMTEADAVNNQNDFHKYALNWTSEALTWIIDDKPMRTLKFADANGGKNFPQTPCNVRLGNWPGGDSDNQGTREWAGGNVTYDKAPFTMTVKSIKVINYSPGTAYKFTDKTGSFESIEVVGAGNAEGAPQNTVVIETSAGATPAPLESGFSAPTATGEAGQGSGSKPTPPAGPGGNNSDANYPTGGVFAPQNSDSPDAEKTPCDCGTATVTVTGAPPPASNAPPAIFTSGFPAVPFSSLLIATSGAPPFPTSSGIAIDTHSAPSVPMPSATSVLPPPLAPQQSGNSTSSASSPEFTGAASHNKAGVLVGALAGAVLLAF